MDDNIVAIVAIVFGTGLAAIIFGSIISLIKQWVKGRHQAKMGSEQLEMLQEDFERYRRKTEQRLQNLEAIIADDDEIDQGEREMDQLYSKQGQSSMQFGEKTSSSRSQQKKPLLDEMDQAEEPQSERPDNEKPEEDYPSEKSRSPEQLKNMLNKKNSRRGK